MNGINEHLIAFDDYWLKNIRANENKCRMMCSNSEDVADVMNDAFVKIRQKINEGKQIKSFKDYTFMTIRNMVTNKHKDRKKRLAIEYPVGLEFENDRSREIKQLLAIEIFEWVVDRYGEHDGWLFRFKYEIGYGVRKLSTVTGLDYYKIYKIIKKIENGIRKNFETKYLEQCKRF